MNSQRPITTVIRDLAGIGVGSFMLIFGTLTNSTNPYLFTFGIGVFGIPGGIGAYHLLARGKPSTPDIPAPSSPSSPSSPSPSPSSSL